MRLAARQFGLVFEQQALAVESLDELRRLASEPKAQSPAPEVPEDTPLRVPPEVEHLHGDAPRPVRA